jgi:hypothetical protein
VAAPAALAAGEDPAVDVGQVAADPILGLVDDDHVKVEINVGPSLLRMIAAGAEHEDPALRDTIAGIRGIRTLVLDLSEVSGDDRVETTVNDLVRRLERSGWERTARIREGSSNINVLIRADEDGLARGLVVLILEGDSNELVFVNLHGVLDLGRLAQIEGLDVPGLEHVPSDADR